LRPPDEPDPPRERGVGWGLGCGCGFDLGGLASLRPPEERELPRSLTLGRGGLLLLPEPFVFGGLTEPDRPELPERGRSTLGPGLDEPPPERGRSTVGVRRESGRGLRSTPASRPEEGLPERGSFWTCGRVQRRPESVARFWRSWTTGVRPPSSAGRWLTMRSRPVRPVRSVRIAPRACESRPGSTISPPLPRLRDDGASGPSIRRGGVELRTSWSRSTRPPSRASTPRALTGRSTTERLVPSLDVTVVVRLRVRSTS
jgi:hypothetical protein